jgi:hypothetical protein
MKADISLSVLPVFDNCRPSHDRIQHGEDLELNNSVTMDLLNTNHGIDHRMPP